VWQDPWQEWRAQDFSHIPIIGLSDLIACTARQQAVATQILEPCWEGGFF
jgi:hypothetical protein